MKIIEPKVELWEENDSVSHVARCARICYRKETGNDKALYDSLIKSKHWSMFRHETVYAIIPFNKVELLWGNTMGRYMECPYIDWIKFNTNFYIVTNGNFLLDIEKKNPVLYKWLIENRVDTDTFEKETKIPNIREKIRYTFKVITQISTSRELNRVSPNNISEQSTRYVYEDGTLCRPHWMTDEDYKIFKDEHKDDSFIPEYYLNNNDKIKVRKYVWSCDRSFFDYKDLIKYGMNKQDARGILPLDTATICAYTYSVREYRDIINLRYYGTTGQPHPNAKIIAGMIRDELIKLGYEFR